MKLRTEFRLRIRRGDDIAVGPGKIDLLASDRRRRLDYRRGAPRSACRTAARGFWSTR